MVFNLIIVVNVLNLVCGEEPILVDTPLATKLNCKTSESRHFHYASKSDLWGEAGGQIGLEVDLLVHCMGEVEPNSIQPACKYLVELSNVRGTPVPHKKETRKKRDAPNESLRRSKRGLRDWFSNAWENVKGFFRRVFNMEEPKKKEEQRETSDVIVFTDRPVTTTTEKMYFDENEVEIFDPSEYESMYRTPYEFVQLADGSVPQIRFAANDTDESVRNFKRHMTDVFATNLNLGKTSKEEVTPMGKHKTKYSFHKTNEASTTTEQPLTSGTDQLTVVRKIKKGDIMHLTPVTGADSRGVNNADNMDLNTVQVQKFLQGDLVSAEGHLDLSVNQIDSRRRRRSADEDSSHLEVKTSYTLELKRRQKRSASDQLNFEHLEKDLRFSSSSMGSSTSIDAYNQNRLIFLRDKLRVKELNHYELSRENNKECLTTLLEALELEAKLGDKVLTEMVNREITPDVVTRVCRNGEKMACVVGILVATSIGGVEYEKLLLDLIDILTTHPVPNRNSLLSHLSTSVSSLPSASPEFLFSLLSRVMDKKNYESVSGPLSVSLAALLVQDRVPVKVRSTCFNDLLGLMQDRGAGCATDDDLLFQLVEAVGMGGIYKKDLISLADKCRSVPLYQSRVLKALRHSMTSTLHQDWILKSLPNASCDFKHTLADVLTSVAKRQRLSSIKQWPAEYFNRVDVELKRLLLANATLEQCDRHAIYKYFEYKEIPETVRALEAYRKLHGSANRKRRASVSQLWDDQTCDNWLNHAKNSREPIDGFLEDGKMYNRWSHCSGKRKLGRGMANAMFDGGMFAGVKYPSNPIEYKVQASLSGEANFLGKDFELGRVGFSVNERKSKTQVELLGRNLLDLKGENCTEDEYIYRPAQHIPLYALNIWVVEVAFGIHLSVDAAVQFKCPRSTSKQRYTFTPSSSARVGGEATGRVLMLRAGINLGGNFNYHLRANLDPYPWACFSAKHGYDPMFVNLESWYQFYKPLTMNDWTKRIRWRPSFLRWNIGGTTENDWVKTYCVLSEDDVNVNTTTRAP